MDATLEYAITFTTKKTTHMEAFLDYPSVDNVDERCACCGSGLEDDYLIFVGCRAKWYSTFVLGEFLLDLLFWYWENYCTLDSSDLDKNIALLILFAGYDVDVVAIEVGY